MNLQIVRTRHPPEAYYEQLVTLIAELSETTDLEDLRRRMKLLPSDDRLFLALDGEALIGYAHFRVAPDLLEDNTVELLAIAVEASRRRRGVGKRLIAAAETWALQAGRDRVRLHAAVVRTEALAFFAALEYQQAMTMQGFTRDLDSARKADAPTEPT